MGGNSSASKEMEIIFSKFDFDKSGMIDRLEIAKYMKINYPNIPVQVVDLFIMLCDKDSNGEIDKSEFSQFYKIVQASVATETDLKNIIYIATSVSENSKTITNTKLIKVLRCFGAVVTKAELDKLEYNKEEFIQQIGKFID
ncbi:Calmodulin [Hexamita inflata]|uniref:Calmodulin n=1 Tax=Hexamita inflata TaxID=28002 RepID=A0AA86QX70_9EUKA|nr:Calmodulin [Hexamita inflata]